MSVQQLLAELGVDSISDGIVELDLAKDALAFGHTAPALPWDESIESALQRIEAELQMLVDASIIEIDYADAA